MLRSACKTRTFFSASLLAACSNCKQAPPSQRSAVEIECKPATGIVILLIPAPDRMHYRPSPETHLSIIICVSAIAEMISNYSHTCMSRDRSALRKG